MRAITEGEFKTVMGSLQAVLASVEQDAREAPAVARKGQVKEEGLRWGICGDCRKSSIARLDNNAMLVRCSEFGKLPPRPIEACTEFEQKGAMELWAMKEIATVLEFGSKGKVGFIRPGEEKHKKLMKFHHHED